MRSSWLLGCIVLAACGRIQFQEQDASLGLDASVELDAGVGLDASSELDAALAPDSGQPDASVPCPAAGGCVSVAPVTTFSVGESHACALRESRLYCWGANAPPRLGICDASASILAPRVVDARAWSAAAVGEVHTCALRGTTIACWGQNYEGATASGDESPAVPRDIAGAWREVSTRRWHTCAIDTSGALFCFGENDFGQIGDDATGTDARAPSRVGSETDWTAVAVGGLFTCGLRAGGQAWCWGENTDGALGAGDTLNRSVPAAVATTERFVEIVAGKHHTCALTADGRAFCWGRNVEGQLGDGTSGPLPQTTPVLVIGSSTWRTLGAGWFHTCAVATDSTLWCWGDNTGMMIEASVNNRVPTPTRIGARSDWALVRAGFIFTCARTVAGELECWGTNESGELGVGDMMPRMTPSPVCFPE